MAGHSQHIQGRQIVMVETQLRAIILGVPLTFYQREERKHDCKVQHRMTGEHEKLSTM